MPGRGHLAISPDGRMIAYTAPTSASATALFIREIGSVVSRQLEGTEGGVQPFWSPDSRTIAFFSEGSMKRVEASGGPPREICAATNPEGGTWNSAGDIVFSDWPVLRRVSAAGGQSTVINAPDNSQGASDFFFPQFLPDGRRFLFSARQFGEGAATYGVFLGMLNSGDIKRIVDGSPIAVYAEPGYLLFQRGNTLFAQSFDAEKGILTGEAVAVEGNLLGGRFGISSFAASRNGILVHRSGKGSANSELVWVDRNGKQLGLAGPPGTYEGCFDLSPDGTRIAVVQTDLASAVADLWVIEWQRNISTRLTFNKFVGGDVAWSPDGLRIAYGGVRRAACDIYEKSTDGIGEETLILDSPKNQWAEHWSGDGKYLAYVSDETDAANLYALPLFGDRKPFPIVQAPSAQDEPRFSPDGRWLAYDSSESGTWQVYVISFPATDRQRRQISTSGGGTPRWRGDGSELYYLGLDGKMMALDVSAGPKLETGIPRPLFATGLSVDPTLDQYAVTSDGQRFLLLKPVTEKASTPITVVLNWTSLLKK